MIIQDGEVVFEQGRLDLSSDEAMAKPDHEQKQDRAEAKAFLLSRLEAGPAPASAVMNAAFSAGSSAGTIRRAKEDLRIRSVQQKDGWYWSLG